MQPKPESHAPSFTPKVERDLKEIENRIAAVRERLGLADHERVQRVPLREFFLRRKDREEAAPAAS